MTTWVLLRGLAREARHWGPFGALLQARAPSGDAVLALDLPGNGARWQERSPTDIDGFASAVQRTLQGLAPGPPYVVVALSLGGMVALRWAAAARGEVSGCVLINSSARGLSPPWQRLHPAAWPALARITLPGRSALARERDVLGLTSNGVETARLAPAWAGYARACPVHPANFVRQLAAAARFRAPEASPVPLLLLASQRDRLVSWRCSQAMAHAWGQPLALHPDAGHDLPLDAPDWVLDQILAWFARLGHDKVQAARASVCMDGRITTGANPPPGVRKLVVWPA